jgi:hypothetical protein
MQRQIRAWGLRGLHLRGHLCRGKDPAKKIRPGLPGADQKALLIRYFWKHPLHKKAVFLDSGLWKLGLRMILAKQSLAGNNNRKNLFLVSC